MTNAQILAESLGGNVAAANLTAMSTAELSAYRAELADLDAEHGRYWHALGDVERVLATRSVTFDPYI